VKVEVCSSSERSADGAKQLNFSLERRRSEPKGELLDRRLLLKTILGAAEFLVESVARAEEMAEKIENFVLRLSLLAASFAALKPFLSLSPLEACCRTAT